MVPLMTMLIGTHGVLGAEVASVPVASSMIGNSTASSCDASTCKTCAEKLSSGCFWCHDLANSGCQSILSSLGSCSNFSFMAPDCECKAFKSCAECSTPKHVAEPMCEWTNSTTNLTLVGPDGLHTTTSIGQHAGCRTTSPLGAFTGPATITTNISLGLGLYVAIVEAPTEWFWGQCFVPGPAPAGVAGGVGALALCCALCLVRCLCRRCCCRRRRRGWTDNNDQLLLSVQSVQAVRPVERASAWPPSRRSSPARP